MASDSGEKHTRKTTICVYCGSSRGFSPAHIDAARRLAEIMAESNIQLVYGGGTVGLMGETAKTLVALSGPDAAHGIIPEALLKFECDDKSPSVKQGGMDIPDPTIYGRTTVVKDMHTRKRMMAEEVFSGGPGSGFIALSGGFGTVEEVLETVTWAQLGIHDRGVCLLNINGFFDGILDFVCRANAEGFIHGSNTRILCSVSTAEAAVEALLRYKVPDSVLRIEWSKM
ncbi:hypothetical protein B0T11DRAFT_230320 [Plectosphaerella cucumerina]|uniref:Cytokinin riboside 5'-monophosphate phosphoribohydrolase n=1 Tax=Plectosphaerella cucumerina TaxID=40658 RepID=A0A8K0T9C9_9PEZI|nr:hypothetical protein B0T11DRAFT_230320 [Plectosphaerella cucumerina]